MCPGVTCNNSQGRGCGPSMTWDRMWFRACMSVHFKLFMIYISRKEQRPVVNCTIIISSSTSCCSFLLSVAISNHLCSGKHLPSYRWKQQQRVGGINCVKSPLDQAGGGERIECKSPVARKSASTSKGVLAKLLYAWCTSLNKL